MVKKKTENKVWQIWSVYVIAILSLLILVIRLITFDWNSIVQDSPPDSWVLIFIPYLFLFIYGSPLLQVFLMKKYNFLARSFFILGPALFLKILLSDGLLFFELFLVDNLSAFLAGPLELGLTLLIFLIMICVLISAFYFYTECRNFLREKYSPILVRNGFIIMMVLACISLWVSLITLSFF